MVLFKKPYLRAKKDVNNSFILMSFKRIFYMVGLVKKHYYTL